MPEQIIVNLAKVITSPDVDATGVQALRERAHAWEAVAQDTWEDIAQNGADRQEVTDLVKNWAAALGALRVPLDLDSFAEAAAEGTPEDRNSLVKQLYDSWITGIVPLGGYQHLNVFQGRDATENVWCYRQYATDRRPPKHQFRHQFRAGKWVLSTESGPYLRDLASAGGAGLDGAAVKSGKPALAPETRQVSLETATRDLRREITTTPMAEKNAGALEKLRKDASRWTGRIYSEKLDVYQYGENEGGSVWIGHVPDDAYIEAAKSLKLTRTLAKLQIKRALSGPNHIYVTYENTAEGDKAWGKLEAAITTVTHKQGIKTIVERLLGSTPPASSASEKTTAHPSPPVHSYTDLRTEKFGASGLMLLKDGVRLLSALQDGSKRVYYFETPSRMKAKNASAFANPKIESLLIHSVKAVAKYAQNHSTQILNHDRGVPRTAPHRTAIPPKAPTKPAKATGKGPKGHRLSDTRKPAEVTYQDAGQSFEVQLEASEAQVEAIAIRLNKSNLQALSPGSVLDVYTHKAVVLTCPEHKKPSQSLEYELEEKEYRAYKGIEWAAAGTLTTPKRRVTPGKRPILIYAGGTSDSATNLRRSTGSAWELITPEVYATRLVDGGQKMDDILMQVVGEAREGIRRANEKQLEAAGQRFDQSRDESLAFTISWQGVNYREAYIFLGEKSRDAKVLGFLGALKLKGAQSASGALRFQEEPGRGFLRRPQKYVVYSLNDSSTESREALEEAFLVITKKFKMRGIEAAQA